MELMYAIITQKHKKNGINIDNNEINACNNSVNVDNNTKGVNVNNNSINVCNNGETETETETETKLNEIKLNYYFNYIYNNEQNFEGISAEQKNGIIHLLEKLGIYISNMQTLKYLKDEQLLEIKIQYWTIKELYLSSYVVYLNQLTPTKFLNKFLLAKEYIQLTKDTLTDFVNYFIKILRNEFDNK